MEKIGIIGLGYVGLPLAVEFGKQREVLGFDLNSSRIEELREGVDKTNEVEPEELKEATKLEFTDDVSLLSGVSIYIVTVPTPIDDFKTPDLGPIKSATRTLGQYLSQGDIVIYESTVFPGCTEEICVPILEEESKLKYNTDFFVGYSPERINPGDKEHRLPNILKITSGSTPEVAEQIDLLYQEIITAGTYKATSIKVAEAAKVIENSQRDVNIAFVNELSLIFNKMGIDTTDVLEAAGTKWNFLKFRPGLVGGHCIGVDPYYLTHKAESVGYHSEVILSGRRINDGMGIFIANRMVKLLNNNSRNIRGSKVLVMGITFKENCPDIRNSRVIDVIKELQDFGIQVDVYDPWADKAEVSEEFGIELQEEMDSSYDGIILAVAHDSFTTIDFEKYSNNGSLIFDVKSFLPKEVVHDRL